MDKSETQMKTQHKATDNQDHTWKINNANFFLLI